VTQLSQYYFNLTVNSQFGGTSGYIISSNLPQGNFALLPNLVIGLSTGQNLTIPPSAYLKPVPNNPGVYAFALTYVTQTSTGSTGSNPTPSQNWFVLGTNFLSNYYTIFSKSNATSSSPMVQLFYTGTSISTSSSSNTLYYILGAAVIVAVIAVGFVVMKGRGGSSSAGGIGGHKKPSSGLELR